jgi:hypothetical protein
MNSLVVPSASTAHPTEIIDAETLHHLRLGQNSPSSYRTLGSSNISSDTDCFKLHQSEFSHLDIISSGCCEVDCDGPSHASHESFMFLRPTLDFSTLQQASALNNLHEEEPVPRTSMVTYSYPPYLQISTSPPPPPRRFFRTFWRSLVRRAVQQTTPQPQR